MKNIAVCFALVFLLVGTSSISYFVISSDRNSSTTQLISSKTTDYFNGDLVSPPLQNTSVVYQNSTVVNMYEGQAIKSEWVTYRSTLCFVMTENQFDNFRLVAPSLNENYSAYELWINDKTHYVVKLLDKEGFLTYNASESGKYVTVLTSLNSGFFTQVYVFNTYLISYENTAQSNILFLCIGTAFVILGTVLMAIILKRQLAGKQSFF